MTRKNLENPFRDDIKISSWLLNQNFKIIINTTAYLKNKIATPTTAITAPMIALRLI